MAQQLVEQLRLIHRGREFHFVSYEGARAKSKRTEPDTEPSWWLMSSGTRWEVMPFDPASDEAEIEEALTDWLDEHVFQSRKKRGS